RQRRTRAELEQREREIGRLAEPEALVKIDPRPRVRLERDRRGAEVEAANIHVRQTDRAQVDVFAGREQLGDAHASERSPRRWVGVATQRPEKATDGVVAPAGRAGETEQQTALSNDLTAKNGVQRRGEPLEPVE